jgi:hypothetical protein
VNPSGGVGGRLAVAGIGATLLGTAITMRGLPLPNPVFFGMLALAAVLIGPAILVLIKRGAGSLSLPAREHPAPRRLLVADECRRVAAQLWALMHSRRRWRRMWQRSVIEHYRNDYRDWALRVFDDAAALGALSPTARELLDGRDVTQLGALPSLFEQAADNLEHETKK